MDPIAAVTAHQLAYAEPNDRDRMRRVVLARVETESGMVGWGECISGALAEEEFMAELRSDPGTRMTGPHSVRRRRAAPASRW